ncbi:Uncharacterised protein [Vibrio cholerae]|nr:Uncharacterised protein [Vibrio cholerae]CSC69858.1 Uncharacterised protein [Vibrio cholerae]
MIKACLYSLSGKIASSAMALSASCSAFSMVYCKEPVCSIAARISLRRDMPLAFSMASRIIAACSGFPCCIA